MGRMAERRYQVVADLSSDNPKAVRPVLAQIVGARLRQTSDGFHADATLVPLALVLGQNQLNPAGHNSFVAMAVGLALVPVG